MSRPEVVIAACYGASNVDPLELLIQEEYRVDEDAIRRVLGVQLSDEG